MICSLKQCLFLVLITLTLVLTFMGFLTMVTVSIPHEYNLHTTKNLLNGHGLTTTCSSPTFTNFHGFSYSFDSFRYSCPFSLSTSFKMFISDILQILVCIIIIYVVVMKKMTWMCSVIVLLCILSTMIVLYSLFFLAKEEINGHNFCLSLTYSNDWEQKIDHLKCHTSQYHFLIVLHLTTAISLLTSGISSYFYIKDYKEQQYFAKKELETKDSDSVSFGDKSYQRDEEVDFGGKDSSKQTDEIDFTALNF
ncbi:Uncharacterized protein QTN25_000661 [Entamoeba marina]